MVKYKAQGHDDIEAIALTSIDSIVSLQRNYDQLEKQRQQLLQMIAKWDGKLEKFLEGKPLAEQYIGRQLLHETTAYAESSVCRRKLLLHYFGESYDVENCGNCDNCQSPKKQVEAKELLETVIETVLALKENF